MLGRLLHLGSGGPAAAPTQTQHAGASKPISSLESVQEDIHTRNLLFPDAQALYQHRNDQVFPLSATPATPSASSSNAFDYSEDVDLDVRDVRVLVMQDTLGPTHTSLLFDSHPAPVSSSPTSSERPTMGPDVRKTPLSSRKGSLTQPSRPLTIQAESPPLRQGAFDRRGSVHGRSQSQAETSAQRATREYKEELATFSSCIFGNSELMAYKGTSTKVHVVPSEPRAFDQAASNFGDGRSSIGRSSARSSKLSQSYSSQTVSPSNAPPFLGGSFGPRGSDRKKVLITRLFPVSLSDESEPGTTPQSRVSDDSNGFPFPAPTEESGPRKKKPQPKQRRTPMYAVVLVVQLPASRVSSTTHPKSTFRESSSYNDQDLFPSSYSSTRFSGWTMAGSGTYGDATDSSYSIDGEDRIDCLTQHWDIIMRTLTHLQSVIATTLHLLLKQVDVASPAPFSTPPTAGHGRAPSLSERRGSDLPRVKPSKSTIKLVSLWPNCLSEDANIASEANYARTRIVKGLRASRVVTGQGRWGIWRDEASWTSKWAASVDQRQFFYNLLTGFLATHTDWLQALCPASYRRRIFLNRRNRNEEDLSLPARTVIVSDDKMAARRLIFLLSAFLPANQQMPGTRTHRPSTSASLGGFSNSPPTFVVPILREESLRRKINRRSGLRRTSHSRTASQSTRASAVPAQLAHLSMERSHERRVSDAASIRTTNLPMPGNDFISRKSSAATTTTIMPETTTPHFSSIHRVDSHRRPRPGSSGSVAADDLKRSLKRGESSGQLSSTSSETRSQGLKWGSLVSGLWSSHRRSSTDHGSFSQTSDLRSPARTSFSQTDKLSEMVREVSAAEEGGASGSHSPRTTNARDVETPRDSIGYSRESFTQPDRTPDPNGAFESPVKTSINVHDGVIDVDVPFPDYITSFESAISSPSSSGYLSTPGLPGGLESFEQSSRLMIDGDLPLNAAGWLDAYHPDFAMQAIPPQDDLLDQVKASLRAEPTPAPVIAPGSGDLSERWVDVGSVIIADVTTHSITRLLYRRLVKPKVPLDKSGSANPGSSNFYGGALLTPSILPYETQLEEEWIQEAILNPDELISDAVDKVTSRNPDANKDSSPASSQAHSEIRASSDSGSTVPETASESTQLAASPGIPRVQCRTVILSALEETIRAVIDKHEDTGLSHSTTHATALHGQNLLRESVRDWVANLEISE